MSEGIGAFSACEWLAVNVPSASARTDDQAARELVLDWQKKLASGGWKALAWPTEYGCRGLSAYRQIAWFEEYVLAGGPSPLDASLVGIDYAGSTLIACGTEEQKAFHLPTILAGEATWCKCAAMGPWPIASRSIRRPVCLVPRVRSFAPISPSFRARRRSGGGSTWSLRARVARQPRLGA